MGEAELNILDAPPANRRRHKPHNVFDDLRMSHVQSAGEGIPDEPGIDRGSHPIPQDPSWMIRQDPCTRPSHEGSEPQAGDEAGPTDPAAGTARPGRETGLC